MNETKQMTNSSPTLPGNVSTGTLVGCVAVSWSLFQLAIAKHFLINADWVRSIHLAFALSLVFLSFTFNKKTRTNIWTGIPIALIAAVASLYLVLDYDGIAARAGQPLPRDIVMGIVFIILLLEGARRSLGLALPLIASSFILLSFCGQYLPEFISFKNASLSKVINKLTLSTEGIYGIPLDVSANIVFLFVLFGAMLEKAGGGKYFIDLAFSLLGRFKGGPAKAAVLASGLTGMVNGSSIANTVTTGTFTIPLMKRTGFSGIKAGAIEVAASTNGQLMPPIMGAAAFIIAEYCNMSYFEVVRAAFIPAFVSYLALIFITHLEASKLGLVGLPKSALPKFWPTLLQGLHFMIPLFFLIYQLVVMRRSAQRSAYTAILALAALMITRHVIRAIRKQSTWKAATLESGKELWDSLVAGAKNMMGIGVAVAAAGIIVGIVTLGLGNVITELIGTLSGGNLILMLLITAVVSLILGMGLPTTANYIVMASLTVPAILFLAEDSGYEIPLIAAHLFCFYFGILSDDTPPVGLSAYAAAAISGEDPIKTGIQGFKYDIRTAILPFMFIFNPELLLIGVSSIGHGLLIFCIATLGLFAFASATQGYLTRKNSWVDFVLLLVATGLLFRPGLTSLWPACLGAFIFGGVWLKQNYAQGH